MRIDSSLAFVPFGTPLSCVAGAGVAIPSQIIDLLGSGVGTAPANIIGTATVFGQDPGVGGGMPVPTFNIVVGTTFLTGSAATLTVQYQASIDAGTPGFTPSSWKTILQSPAYTAAQLLADTVIFRADLPPTFPDNLNPRFLRLNFAVLAATTFTAGTIKFAYPVVVRDDLANKNAVSNFVVH
jgi:hypothetical protein